MSFVASVLLVDALRQYRLLEPAQLDELPTFQDRFPSSKALAGELIRRKWLSAYQANQLLQGRGSELLLGSYVLLERLGEGGMGQVFKARNWKLGRIVALKLIRKERLSNIDAIRRFEREVRVAAALSHPNIVMALDADHVGGTHLLIMEYVEGSDLAALVKKNGPLPIAVACDCVRQAALGLQHAHERGMVHRDIKPQNLLIPADGSGVKILDMGLARLEAQADDGEPSSTLTQEGSVMGTLDYIAPEQALNSHTADIRADLYSLGCTMYYLLTARAPFAGGSATEKLLRHQMEPPPPVEQLRPEVPPAVTAVLSKLLAKRPEQRYQTPAEAAEALAVVGSGSEKHASAAGPSGSGAAMRAGRTAPIESASETRVNWSSVLHYPSTEEVVQQLPRPRTSRNPRRVLLAVAGSAALLSGLLLMVLLLARSAQNQKKKTNTKGTAEPMELLPTFTNRLGMEFILVQKGKSWLGGGGGKPGDKQVEIAHDFYLGTYEVTQEEWQKVMEVNPSHFSRTGPGKDALKDIPDADLKRFPVEQVSWRDAQAFLARLNNRYRETGWVYRLPKETEWEYACRGGPMADQSESAFDFYLEKPMHLLPPDKANFSALNRTCKVGSYPPNRLGLYDMHGNVWEWCDDVAAGGATARVLLSGGWHYTTSDCRAVNRRAHEPSDRYDSLGLRVARVPTGKEKK